MRLKELNEIVKKNLYIGNGNQKRENENFWACMSKEKLDGYDEIVAERKEDIYLLAKMIEWEGSFNLQEIFSYIKTRVENRES